MVVNSHRLPFWHIPMILVRFSIGRGVTALLIHLHLHLLNLLLHGLYPFFFQLVLLRDGFDLTILLHVQNMMIVISKP